MAHLYTMQQLHEDEFDRVTLSADGTTPKAIPKYFKVDSISGEITIWPRLPHNKRVVSMLISLEDKDGRR